MPHDNRHSTLVRGADGVLYEVSDDASKPVPTIPDEAPTSGTEPSDRVMAGHSDHIAARIMIDPGDHEASRIMIDPGDHEASRVMIDPGDHASSRVMIDPGDHEASRVMIQPANA